MSWADTKLPMLTSLFLLASALDPGGSVAASSGVPKPSPWPAGRFGTGPSDNAIGTGAGTAVFFARTGLGQPVLPTASRDLGHKICTPRPGQSTNGAGDEHAPYGHRYG